MHCESFIYKWQSHDRAVPTGKVKCHGCADEGLLASGSAGVSAKRWRTTSPPPKPLQKRPRDLQNGTKNEPKWSRMGSLGGGLGDLWDLRASFRAVWGDFGGLWAFPGNPRRSRAKRDPKKGAKRVPKWRAKGPTSEQENQSKIGCLFGWFFG